MSLCVLCVYVWQLKGNHFKTKYRPAGTLLNCNATIYFKFRFKLKCINSKIYFSTIVNFHTGLC